MAISREERTRILAMVAAGQVSVEEAEMLFDALLDEPSEPPPRPSNRTVRVWVTDMTTRSRKVNMTATLPLGVLKAGLHALDHLIPSLHDSHMEEIVRSLEQGGAGRVM